MDKWTCLCNSIMQKHSLSQAAIGRLIVEYCEENGFLRGSDVETLRGIQNELISLSSSKKSFLSKNKPLLSAVSSSMKTVEERSRKAKLCLKYFKEVSVMHYFVRAGRTGIVADGIVNCDSAEELGENAAKGIVGKRLADMTLKRKVQVFTLAAMENTKLIDTDPVVFNPNQLFHRIVCVLRSADDLEGCLQCEWAPYLQSLFDDVALRAGRR
ncbi:hypothetical protein AVEN_221429-1 [Araneus ventricosus]|uniref:Uncharacterized protein n=1 Tax=Araneus ventricosus TaxID=182803 RepID=A0A4Y2MQ82_ARAVE|nr:hypothetical protein AVEN_221429-1 [Araneus ventricosus]